MRRGLVYASAACLVSLGWLTSCTEVPDDTGAGGSSDGGTAMDGGAGGVAPTSGPTGMGGSPPPVCDFIDYTDPASFEAAPVSFIGDVMPILQQRCTGNGSNCHSTGDPTPSSGLYLAPPSSTTLTSMHADDTHATLVSVTSSRSTLAFIEPSDPAASFLLMKVEYDTPSICLPEGASCSPNCGRQMPTGTGSVVLTDGEKSILRTWIRDGALND